VLLSKSQTKIDWSSIYIGTDTISTETRNKISKFFSESNFFPDYSPEEFEHLLKLNDSFYNTLTLSEQVIYNLYYPSLYAQNCAPSITSDSTHKYVYRELHISGIESYYSDRQKEWIAKNRKIIVAKLNVYLINNSLSLRMVYLIMENNFYECIPGLISAYKRQTNKPDHILISLLYKMIDENEFDKKKQTITFTHFEKKGIDGKQLANPYIIKEILNLAEEFYIFKMQKE
jgi:hypothetical protein